MSEQNAKLKKLEAQRERSNNLLDAYQPEELEKGSKQCANVVERREVKCLWPQFSSPPGWSNTTQENSSLEEAQVLSEEMLERLVLGNKVSIAVAESGALPKCGMEYKSTCGCYDHHADPFVATGRKSDNIFRYIRGRQLERGLGVERTPTGRK